MKVLLLNGSPHETGCTYTALKEVSDELERCGVETEIFHIKQPPDGLHGLQTVPGAGQMHF